MTRLIPFFLYVAILVAVGYAATWLKEAWKRRNPPPPTDPLDKPLLWWTESDALSVRDFMAGGVLIMGRPGSGKTSGSGKALMNAVLKLPGSGGVILSAKPGEDLAMWKEAFKAAGKEGDLIVFAPGEPWRFNVLADEMRHGGHTRNIVKFMTTVAETLRGGDTKGGEASDEWEKQSERMLYNAVEMVKLAYRKVDPWDLQRFITDAAPEPKVLLDPEKIPAEDKKTRDAVFRWKSGFHFKTILLAKAAEKTPVEEHDFKVAMDYWLGELPFMADRTRSSVLIGVYGILHVFNTGIVRELLSTETNVSPEDTLKGRFVLVDMPQSEYGDVGSFVQGAWRYKAQKAVLRRHAKEADGVHVIWSDEFQTGVTSFDPHYINQSRSHKGCMVCLTQSIHGLYAALKGRAGEAQAHMLISGFGHQVFHALGDHRTAEYAQNLVGREVQVFVGTSMAPGDCIFDEILGITRVSTSTNSHYEHTLQTNVFLSGMRTGGPRNGYLVDGVVIRSGEPFSTGDNWLWATFSQRGEA